jgi:transcriptional regulator with XRE-family HTH domain
MKPQDAKTKGERVTAALESTGLSPAAAAKRLGCSREAIQQWISGKTKNIKNELLFSFSDLTRFEARWIATGKGPIRTAPRPVDEQEQTLALTFRSLDERGRAAVLGVAQREASYQVKPGRPALRNANSKQ